MLSVPLPMELVEPRMAMRFIRALEDDRLSYARARALLYP